MLCGWACTAGPGLEQEQQDPAHAGRPSGRPGKPSSLACPLASLQGRAGGQCCTGKRMLRHRGVTLQAVRRWHATWQAPPPRCPLRLVDTDNPRCRPRRPALSPRLKWAGLSSLALVAAAALAAERWAAAARRRVHERQAIHAVESGIAQVGRWPAGCRPECVACSALAAEQKVQLPTICGLAVSPGRPESSAPPWACSLAGISAWCAPPTRCG